MRLQDMNGLQLADALLEKMNVKDDLEGYRLLTVMLASYCSDVGDEGSALMFMSMYNGPAPLRRKQ